MVLGIVSEFLVIDSFAGMVYEIDAIALGNRRDTAGEHPCLRIFGRYGNLATESVDITAFVILGIHDKAILVGRKSNLVNALDKNLTGYEILNDARLRAMARFDECQLIADSLLVTITVEFFQFHLIPNTSNDTGGNYNTDG